MKSNVYKILAILLVLGLGLLGGCGRKAGRDEPGFNHSAAGSKISIGSAVEPETWNPMLSEQMAAQEIGRLIFSGLLLQDDKGAWLPDLAVEVPTQSNGGISGDGLTLTYRLRPNLRWQDGQPVSSRDVQFTYEFLLRNRNRVPWRDGYEKIVSLVPLDDLTVVMRFSEPYAYAFQLFPCILPSHRAGELSDARSQNYTRLPIGSGPFLLKEWRRGDALVFEANPNYYRGRPALESITYKIASDRQIVLSQLKIGEVDLVNNITFEQLGQASAVNGVNTFITRGVVWEHLDFNLNHPLFADVRVRQAVALGIDRRGIVEKTLKNAAFIAFTDIHPLSWAALPLEQQPAANVAQAKELLTAAGWSRGSDGILVREGRRFSFHLSIPSGDAARRMAAGELERQLRELGIEAKIQPLDGKVFFNEWLPNRRFEAALFAWVNSTEPDNYDLWHSSRIPTAVNRWAGKNYAGWKSPEADRLLYNTRQMENIDLRRDEFKKLQELLLTESPVIPLYYRAEFSAAKRSLANFKPNPFAGNLWNAWEWKLR